MSCEGETITMRSETLFCELGGNENSVVGVLIGENCIAIRSLGLEFKVQKRKSLKLFKLYLSDNAVSQIILKP